MMKKILCILAAAFLLGAFPMFAAQPLADGTYQIDVAMTGGTGRVTMQSPCTLTVQDGNLTAAVSLSSKNYQYIRMGETFYYALRNDETSDFEIPILLDTEILIAAQTVAMGEPREIEYVLTFSSATAQPFKKPASALFYGFCGIAAVLLLVGAALLRKKRG